MKGAGRDGHDAAETAHGDRGVAIDRGPVAELAGYVVSPRPHGAIRQEGETVEGPGNNGDPTADTVDRDRGKLGGPAPVAELAVIVVPPGTYGAVGEESEAVVSSPPQWPRRH